MSAIIPAPNKDAILKALEVASLTPEAAAYLYKRLSDTLSKVNIEASDEVIKRVGKFVKDVNYRFDNRADSWGGNLKAIRTDFQNAQYNHGISSLKDVSSTLTDGNIKMDFAINDEAQLLRAFSIDGQPLDAQTATALDNLFNAWLAENEMVSKDSVIYESEADGHTKVDKNGKAIKADAERVRQLIADRDQGFGQYLTDKLQRHVDDKNLTASVQRHNYPAQPQAQTDAQPTAPTRSAAPETVSPVATTEPTATTPTVEPGGPDETIPTTPNV
ncbi:hypothetical protein ACNVED_01375 [Legionella sp. D16C41]|uniref:hypothetical protein n=1 Tax=Legionella sp. D16C41 TaxID=3402688 RepID=UPI003AF5EBD5